MTQRLPARSTSFAGDGRTASDVPGAAAGRPHGSPAVASTNATSVAIRCPSPPARLCTERSCRFESGSGRSFSWPGTRRASRPCNSWPTSGSARIGRPGCSSTRSARPSTRASTTPPSGPGRNRCGIRGWLREGRHAGAGRQQEGHRCHRRGSPFPPVVDGVHLVLGNPNPRAWM